MVVRALNLFIFLLVIPGSLCAGELRVIEPPSIRATDILGVNYDYSFIFTPSHDDASIFMDIYVARETYNRAQPYEFEILDSLHTPAIFAADTNIIVYVSVGEENTHLISMTLSPGQSHDTLLSIANTDDANWLAKLKMGPTIHYSFHDSVIVYQSGETIKDAILPYPTPDRTFANIDIVKILPDNGWKLLSSFDAVLSRRMANDKSQVYICTSMPEHPADPPEGSVIVYDLTLDSAYLAEGLGQSNLVVKRLDTNSPFFYIKVSGDDWNLWEYSENTGAKQITEYKYPQRICCFSVFKDYIRYPLNHPGSEETTIEYISLDN